MMVRMEISAIEQEDTRNSEHISTHFSYTIAQIIAAVRYEMAVTLIDVMARRTRMLLLDARAARQCMPQVAHIMAQELGEERLWIEQQQTEFYKFADRYLPKII